MLRTTLAFLALGALALAGPVPAEINSALGEIAPMEERDALAFAEATPASLEERATSCSSSGVYILVARGTNETPGLGRASAVASGIIAKRAGSTAVPVDYPAVAFPQPFNPPTASYVDSVNKGIADTISKIKAYKASCSTARIVLVGFSQGGQVMTDTLAGGFGQNGPIDSTYLPYIKATVVFGDTTHTSGSNYNAGNGTGSGIFARNDASNGALNSMSGKLRSYCSLGDPICQGGSGGSGATNGADIHVAEIYDHTTEAVNFVLGLV